MAMPKHQKVEIPDVQIGSWHWFTGYGPKKTKGSYKGNCNHTHRSVIAHGPDLRHFDLSECNECHCRAWFTDKSTRSTPWLEMESN